MVLQDAKVHFNEQDTEIIGILEADLIHLTATSGGVGGELTETTFDTTTHAEGAIIKLTNSTGVSKIVTHCSIRGRLVARLSGKLGFLHDAFNDYERIAVEGERLFELANNYIVTAAQVRKLADYFWKFHRAKRHIYTIDMPGTWHWICPGEVYTLQIGGVGQKEYIDSVCVCMDVQTSRGAKDLGQTTIALQELYQNWVFDSNALSRFIARGCPGGVKSFPYVVVASQFDPGAADYYCDGTADQVEIQAANDYLVGSYGGGTIHLRKGTYNLTVAISLGSNVILEGEGAASIIKKNCNDYAIKAVGTSGAHLTNVGIHNLTVTRDAADTNAKPLIYISYVDGVILERIVNIDAIVAAVYVVQCSGVNIVGIDISGMSTLDGAYAGIYLNAALGSIVANNHIHNISAQSLTVGIRMMGCNDAHICNNQIDDIRGGLKSNGLMAGIHVTPFEVQSSNNNRILTNRIADITSYADNYVGPPAGVGLIIAGPSMSNANVVGTNFCFNNGNLIIYGNCESATPPHLTGETDDTQVNCTFARSADFKHNGANSYKFTKVANANFMYFHNALSKTDLVGLVAGCSYTLSMWVWVPSAAGSPLGTEIIIGIEDDIDPAAWVATEVAAADLYNQWQLVTVTLSLRATATGAGVYVRCLDAATDGEIFYVDDIRLRPDGVSNEHGSNYSNAGTGTRASNNSWQSPFQV